MAEERERAGSGRKLQFPQDLARAEICYCFVRWLYPLPSGSEVTFPGFPRVSRPVPLSGVFGYLRWAFTQVEVEDGEDFWVALVVRKHYDPASGAVFFVTADLLELPHNTYSKTRTRWIVWPFAAGAWSPWVKTTGPTLTDTEAINRIAQECASLSAVAIPCP